MSDVAIELYRSINSVKEIRDMIANNASNDLYLECAVAKSSKLSQEVQSHLATALSGFSNTSGGVILYGVETQRHAHSGEELLSRIAPVDDAERLAAAVKGHVPRLTTPAAPGVAVQTIQLKPESKKGIVAIGVPMSVTEPVQSTKDEHFYYRSGGRFNRMPYQMIKKLFSSSGAENPDLVPKISGQKIKKGSGLMWTIPIEIRNKSNSAARHAVVAVAISNASDFQGINAVGLKDQSGVNPRMKILTWSSDDKVFHKGLDQRIGAVSITRGSLEHWSGFIKMQIRLFADRMPATQWQVELRLQPEPYEVSMDGPEYL